MPGPWDVLLDKIVSLWYNVWWCDSVSCSPRKCGRSFPVSSVHLERDANDFFGLTGLAERVTAIGNELQINETHVL